MLGITEHTYIGDESTYLTLLYRIYILLFMIRYQMPLQRKFWSGNRNLSTTKHCFKGKGWYCSLTRYEQKLLNNPGIVLSSESTPDDMLHGIFRSDLENLSSLLYSNIQNTSMFRDGSTDSMEFQHKIQMFR